MSRDAQFDDLWDSPSPPLPTFQPGDVAHLPETAQRYFRHAIAAGTPGAFAVRLRMRGEIRLKDSWDPFEAEQVMRVHRGFVWRATVKMKGLPVKGSDRWVDGHGRMRWKLLGIIPLVNESGPDVSRSAAGRGQIEGVWLPSALLAESLDWEEDEAGHATAKVQLGDAASRVELTVDDEGRLQEAAMLRWGTPDGEHTPAREERFGCIVEDEGTFGGDTVPTRLRVGWFFGTERFVEDGEFFRCEVEHAEYR